MCFYKHKFCCSVQKCFSKKLFSYRRNTNPVHKHRIFYSTHKKHKNWMTQIDLRQIFLVFGQIFWVIKSPNLFLVFDQKCVFSPNFIKLFGQISPNFTKNVFWPNKFDQILIKNVVFYNTNLIIFHKNVIYPIIIQKFVFECS